MATQVDLFGATPAPRQGAGETYLQYQRRHREWLSQQAESGSVKAAGIPSTGLPALATVPQVQAGDFRIAATKGLPIPVHLTAPAWGIEQPRAQPPPGADESFAFQSVPARVGTTSELTSAASRLVGPDGSVAPGLRPPYDPSESDVARAFVLAATGYDLNWGVPAATPGLKWSAHRYIYEPELDQEGLPFQAASKRGLYVQSYQDSALGTGLAGLRWVKVDTLQPTPALPYRALSAAEGAAIWTNIEQYRGLAEDNLLAKQMKGEVGFREDPNAPKYVSAYTLPPRIQNEQDFAWIRSSALPAGMPYSGFPYTPIPMPDFLSGAWLAPGYRPRGPLPRGFESILYLPVAPPSGPMKPE